MKLARDFEACRRRLVIPASLAIALMAAGIGSAPAVASSGWSIQPTPNLSGPPQGGLDSVSCTAASACAAVGDYVNPSGTGVPLAERWNGTEWTVQSVPNPGGSGVLSGVSCGGANSCTAVGNYVSSLGTVVTLAEHWNGTSWAIQTTPDPAGASRSVLSGVSCTADGACTAVGYYVNSSGTGQTLAEHWDASGWKIETTATPSGGGDLARVSCSAATACTALGQASGTTLVYRWDGSKWSSQMIAIPAGATSTELNGVSCMGASACTGVGNWHEVRCNNGQPSCNCFKSPGCTFRAGTLVEQWNGERLVGPVDAQPRWKRTVRRSVRRILHRDGLHRRRRRPQRDPGRAVRRHELDSRGHPWPKRGRQPVERVVHSSRRVRGCRDWQWRDARRGVERHQLGDSGHHQSAGTGEPQPLRRVLPDEHRLHRGRQLHKHLRQAGDPGQAWNGTSWARQSAPTRNRCDGRLPVRRVLATATACTATRTTRSRRRQPTLRTRAGGAMERHQLDDPAHLERRRGYDSVLTGSVVFVRERVHGSRRRLLQPRPTRRAAGRAVEQHRLGASARSDPQWDL